MGPRNAKGFERILFPTDFSQASGDAASYAQTLARQYGSRIVVLHVIDVTEEAAGFYVPHLSYEKLDKEMAAGAQQMLEKYCAKVFRGFKNLEMKVVAGEPYKEILKSVKGSKIDMIVMGLSGKAALDRFLFGSTTERVMRKTTCPVLVIPPSR